MKELPCRGIQNPKMKTSRHRVGRCLRFRQLLRRLIRPHLRLRRPRLPRRTRLQARMKMRRLLRRHLQRMRPARQVPQARTQMKQRLRRIHPRHIHRVTHQLLHLKQRHRRQHRRHQQRTAQRLLLAQHKKVPPVVLDALF